MNSEGIKLGLWSGAGGAILATYVGFNFGGWVTKGDDLYRSRSGEPRTKPGEEVCDGRQREKG